MTHYDDTPVKWMLYPSLFFMLFGMSVGLFISINGFLFPDYFAGEYIHFGKVRPVHVGSVALLWLLSIGVALFYYFVPRLCGVPLWSRRLGIISSAMWWAILPLGVLSYPWGTNFGWEYAEFPDWVSWIPTKPLFVLTWVLVVINLFMTVLRRKYQKMYVSLWYAMGTCIWASVVLIVGSYGINWVPPGISRVNVSFFYVHNLVGLIFTPMGLATAYYFLPKIANVPIYSHRLSMVGFWSIAFVYAWVGAHHIIHGPIAQWLQTVSIIFSIWLFVPVWTVVTNIFATLAGRWDLYTKSVPIRFIIVGNLYYLITSVQGSFMALRNVNEITSKTDWVISHAHIALYGAFTYFAMAGIYHVVPNMAKRPLWSNKLAEWHFNLNLWGGILFMFPLLIGGYFQGMLWATWANGANYAEMHTQLANFSFLDTVAEMRPWWIMRSWGGAIVLLANILFAINIFNTAVLPKERQVAEGAA